MIGRPLRLFVTFVATKILFIFKPALKIVLKNFLISTIIIVIIIYSHNEFLNWSTTSGNIEFLKLSFIFKNVLIFITLLILFFSIKRSKLKNDGFDKFRNRKLRTTKEIKLGKK
jgi:predicted membrane protein|tara:strand:- start:466 stop:807 length:342 start_codon:yes stop_codon:yes gene_type:complete